MEAEKMDRGVTDACQAHLGGSTKMDIRQTRRGWIQECFGCEARTEFKYLVGEQQVAHSLQDSNCFCRICCSTIYPFVNKVTELNTDAELLTIDRPCRCAAGSCKCCCYQEITISSGGQNVGRVKETCWFCIPSLKVYNKSEQFVYLIHPPTCCCGIFMNCCTEGNPCCGRGCCKVPFRIYPADQEGQTGGDAPYIGKILKKPKSLATEIFTDANAFEVDFPDNATVDQKALLVGTAVFLNAIFFEER